MTKPLAPEHLNYMDQLLPFHVKEKTLSLKIIERGETCSGK